MHIALKARPIERSAAADESAARQCVATDLNEPLGDCDGGSFCRALNVDRRLMQNIYDDPDFFAGYAELRRTESGWNAALEQPALQSLLPMSLHGMAVLDLGCGFGDFARLARSRGARHVTAVDISRKMLAAARAATDDKQIEFIEAPIETFDMGIDAFDLVVSSLALHYVENYRAVVEGVARALRRSGRLIFSVEHPTATALGTYEWQRDENGAKLHWKLDRYREEGYRESTWFVPGVIKYHRMVDIRQRFVRCRVGPNSIVGT